MAVAAVAAVAGLVPAQAAAHHGHWRIVAEVGPAGGVTTMQGVAATSARDAWAVGTVCSPCGSSSVRRLLVEHWNGSAWAPVRLPATVARYWDAQAVSASSYRDVWIFSGNYRRSRAVRWDGHRWRTTGLPSWTIRPDRAGESRNVPAVLARNDVWVFSPFAEMHPALAARYDGSRWHRQYLPGEPFAVSALARHDIWAVGPSRSTMSRPLGRQVYLAMHWNGRAWRSMRLPTVRSSSGVARAPTGLVVLSSRDIFVGFPPSTLGARGTLLHWNGRRWGRVTVPPRVFEFPAQAPDAQDGHGGLWMQGLGRAPRDLLYMYHYSGGRWSRQLMPHAAALNLAAFSWVPGSRTVLAVGHVPAGNDAVRAVIAQYGG